MVAHPRRRHVAGDRVRAHHLREKLPVDGRGAPSEVDVVVESGSNRQEPAQKRDPWWTNIVAGVCARGCYRADAHRTGDCDCDCDCDSIERYRSLHGGHALTLDPFLRNTIAEHIFGPESMTRGLASRPPKARHNIGKQMTCLQARLADALRSDT